MKIAISHTRYSYVGGVEKYIFSLVERLLDDDHEVHYFCHFWDRDADPRIRFHRIPNTFKLIRALKVWSFDRWSEAAIARDRFDIIHGFTKTAKQDIYTDGSGCLLDYQEYSINDGIRSPLLQKLRRASPHQRLIETIERERFSRGNFRRVVAMSRFAQKQICRRYQLEESEVEVLYNGIDLGRFNPEKAEELRALTRRRLNYGDEDIVVLLVGNDYRRKGVLTLMQALQEIESSGGLPSGRRLQIAIVGKERPARERELYQWARDRDLEKRVRFYGPQREIAEWHAMSDLHALPSRFDIFGNVVLEAMAMGVPAIVSSQAGAAEVIAEDETGYVQQDPRDAKELATLIRRAAEDPAKLAALGQAAQEAARQYSWDRHFGRMLEIYREVAEEKKREQAGSAA